MEIAALICNEKLDIESALKTYSIFKCLKDTGNQIQIIDYNYINADEKNIFSKIKSKKLYNFLDKNIIFTARRYESIEQLEDDYPLADNFLEVNPKQSELDIFPKNKCIVYGVKDINRYYIDSMKEGFKAFYTEQEFENEENERVVDPLFLLSNEQWQEFGEKSLLSDKSKDYVLIYAKEVSKEMLIYAKNIAQAKKVKIYIVTDKMECLLYRGKRILNPTPADIVKLIYNATDVITSKNDGIKLSFLFGKKIHIFFDSKNELQMELINGLKLLDRIVTSQDRVILKDVEKNEMSLKIELLREKSLRLLRNE